MLENGRYPVVSVTGPGGTCRVAIASASTVSTLSSRAASALGYGEIGRAPTIVPGKELFGLAGPLNVAGHPIAFTLAAPAQPGALDRYGPGVDGTLGLPTLGASRFAVDLATGRAWVSDDPGEAVERYGVAIGSFAFREKAGEFGFETTGSEGWWRVVSLDGRSGADILADLRAGGRRAYDETLRSARAMRRAGAVLVYHDGEQEGRIVMKGERGGSFTRERERRAARVR